MQDILSLFETLRRPRLLIRTARIGAQEYRRTPHLNRLFGTAALPRHGAALMRLLEMEADLEDLRKSDNANYRVGHHVEVLCAMMGEAKLLKARSQP